MQTGYAHWPNRLHIPRFSTAGDEHHVRKRVKVWSIDEAGHLLEIREDEWKLPYMY